MKYVTNDAVKPKPFSMCSFTRTKFSSLCFVLIAFNAMDSNSLLYFIQGVVVAEEGPLQVQHAKEIFKSTRELKFHLMTS